MAAAQVAAPLHLLPAMSTISATPSRSGRGRTRRSSRQRKRPQIRIAMEELFRREAETPACRPSCSGPAISTAAPAGKLARPDRPVQDEQGHLHVGRADGILHDWAYLPDLGKAFVALARNLNKLGVFERLNFAGHTRDRSADQGGRRDGERPQAEAEGHAVVAAARRRPIHPDDARDRQDVLSWRSRIGSTASKLERTVGKLPATDPGRRHPPGDRRSALDDKCGWRPSGA